MKVYSIFLACLLLAPSLPLVAADPVEVKIGLLNPLTGPIADFAPGFTDAAEVAIAELNEIYDGDYEFELVEADSGCDGTTAASSTQSLIDHGVVGIAGAACSGATLGAIDVA
ncbi:MAG: ABC transporter substrate-binding protein, partial [Candidatus Thermoplasmatota archaeon]|nr:ABC transporter substrate-binding protein [Candidatus Thermoplasmatota archaeon]